MENYTNKDGAKKHGNAIARYWQERGGLVTFEVIKTTAKIADSTGYVYSIKTDMVGGLPTYWKRPASCTP